MSQAMNNLSGDPSQLSMKQKLELFEKSSDKNEKSKPLTFFNNFSAISAPYHKRDISTDNNASLSATNTTSNNNTSTPLSYGMSFPAYRVKSATSEMMHVSNKSSPSTQTHHSFPTKFPGNINQMITDHQNATSYYKSLGSKVQDTSVNMREFHEAIKDLDTFLARELNEIEIQKRIGLNKNVSKEKIVQEKKGDIDRKYGDQILETLHKLKDEINAIKENQKDFEDKIRRQEEYQYMKIAARINQDQENNQRIAKTSSKSDTILFSQSSESSLQKKASSVEKNCSSEKIRNQNSKKEFDSPILASSGYSREERIRKLEAEIYKEETLMMKINRVLENLKNVDDRNLLDIINIERHYLVASTRFQSALSEIRKLNENIELPHLPPFNRKGRLLIRDIMLEVKSSYFQRPLPIKNEYLLILMKYEDKVYATKPMRIIDDVRIIKFTEKFSIPEIYMDFDMRLEIYGTTFWRKNASVRETMLKKYGFITFSLSDTGNKSKRFQMIEVLQSDNVPIRNKVTMKISQKITTDVQYKGNLFVKLRDVWHEATAHLNGHLLEISFKKIYNSGVTRSQEVMLLDLYNVDSDAVIPVDVRRISDKPYTFLLKFNHYVDVANFYLMVAAESTEAFSEWINSLNKVLVLIK